MQKLFAVCQYPGQVQDEHPSAPQVYTQICCESQVCQAAGVLAIGHINGEIRVYQFSATRTQVSALLLQGLQPATTEGFGRCSMPLA